MQTPIMALEATLREIEQIETSRGITGKNGFQIPRAIANPIMQLEHARAKLAEMKGTTAAKACPVVSAAYAQAEAKVKAALAKPTTPTAATNAKWSRSAEHAALKSEAATRAEHVKEYNSLQTPRQREAYRNEHRADLGLPRRN